MSVILIVWHVSDNHLLLLCSLLCLPLLSREVNMSISSANKYAEGAMDTIDQVKDRLVDRNLKAVAEKSGIHYNTLYRLVSSDNPNPHYDTRKKIIEYLDKQDSQSK